ncbi:DUF2913 family protein [Scandinavium goeteborgense]|uniref:DUF2913 family protein n=1 Tax=Scandinavium goeteborgense TaxID=1851514 RepID=UPI0021661A08|nr:DUF2913 family protein [Scandinavium goeteborgense]MCS2153228.1 DUF2913 family protein [Scandinavium goeteborgense]
MKSTTQQQSAEQTVADLAHFAWCALIALHLAWQDGQALSPLGTHTFLLRWLAVAQKQRRFPKSVAGDIDTLLTLGRKKGPGAGLHARFGDLFDTCSQPAAQQSALHRLTYAIEKLKTLGWINEIVGDEEWCSDNLAAEYKDIPALLMRKTDLQHHFSEKGRLTSTVDMMAVGDADNVIDVFSGYALLVSVRQRQAGWHVLTLCSDQT